MFDAIMKMRARNKKQQCESISGSGNGKRWEVIVGAGYHTWYDVG